MISVKCGIYHSFYLNFIDAQLCFFLNKFFMRTKVIELQKIKAVPNSTQIGSLRGNIKVQCLVLPEARATHKKCLRIPGKL